MACSRVLSSNAVKAIGGLLTRQVETICHHSWALCGRVSVATASAVAIVWLDSIAHIFIAGLLQALQQKQIDTYKLLPHWDHMTHLKLTKKEHFGLLKILRKDWFPWRPGGQPATAH